MSNKAAPDVLDAPAQPVPLKPVSMPDDGSVSNDTLLLHSILSNLTEGVVILDQEGRLSLINSAAHKMVPLSSGVSAVFLSPESWGAYSPDAKNLFPVDDFPVARALRGETVEAVEFAVRRAEAPEILWIQARARPLVRPNNSQAGCVVFLRDISVLKQMGKDLLEASGAEKKRLGQDLHDGVCQILAGLKYMCNVLVGKLNSRDATEAGDVREIQLLVSQALMEADALAKGMFPVRLEAGGLVSALEELVSQASRSYRVSCRLLCENRILIHNPEVALHVYRIAQEAITNAIKHGKAKNIVLWLTCTDGRFTLIVKNDGAVSSVPSSRQGMGRRIMSARARQIGAVLQFEQSSGGGTVLTCEFSDSLAPAAECASYETSSPL